MRQEKQLLLDEMKQKIKDSSAFIITRYQQLRATPMGEFRRSIEKTGGNFAVVRKRVFIKAAQDLGISFSKEEFDGHIGIVYTEKDSVELAKAFFQFSQDNQGALDALVGRFDGKSYNAKQIEMLSKLPGVQGMRAELLGLFEAPMAQTLSVMEAILTSIPHCLENKCQKEQQD